MNLISHEKKKRVSPLRFVWCEKLSYIQHRHLRYEWYEWYEWNKQTSAQSIFDKTPVKDSFEKLHVHTPTHTHTYLNTALTTSPNGYITIPLCISAKWTAMNYDRPHVVSLTFHFEAMPTLPPHTGDPEILLYCLVFCFSYGIVSPSIYTVMTLMTQWEIWVCEKIAHMMLKNKWHSRWEQWFIHNTAQPLVPYCYNTVILSYRIVWNNLKYCNCKNFIVPLRGNLFCSMIYFVFTPQAY